MTGDFGVVLIGQKVMKPVQFICSVDISEVKLSCQVCAYLLSDWFHKTECQEIVLVRLCHLLPSNSLGECCKGSLTVTPTKTIL